MVRFLLALAGATLFLCLEAEAQSLDSISTRSGMVYAGSFSDTITVDSGNTKRIRCTICVWLTDSSSTEYSISAGSVSLDNIGAIAAADLFARIAAHAVVRGVALGYTLSPASGPATARVAFAASVEHTATGFRACTSDLNISTFSCTSLAGITTVHQTGCSGGEGVTGCESTCATTLLQ
jgi:hypothetical protein